MVTDDFCDGGAVAPPPALLSLIANTNKTFLESAMLSTIRTSMIAVVFALASAASAWAGSVTIPNTFSANTPAVAAQVNANFSAVASSLNGNVSDIASLQNQLNALNQTINNQAATITNLQNQLTTLQSNTVLQLGGDLTLTTVGGYPTAQFSGINVQIVNGAGTTNTTNGLGNLTIGYNETDASALPFCSAVDGSGSAFQDHTTCTNNGGTWAANQRTGSHNLIVGYANAYTQFGGFVAGSANVINGQFASISGGVLNMASGAGASVSGGGGYDTNNNPTSNIASGRFASVSGGFNNTASGANASVSGGISNIASGQASSISGGYSNTASNTGGNNTSAWVGGGAFNSANGNVTAVSGGFYNTADANGASVCGGFTNAASGFQSTVSGGAYRTATDQRSWVGGSYTSAN